MGYEGSATEGYERLSPVATISRHTGGLLVDRPLIERKAEDARASARRREIHVLHAGDADNPQRMLNALEPGSYIAPHRHLTVPKAEALVVLSGSVGVVVFDDQGGPRVQALLCLEDRGAGSGPAFDLRAGVWHTMFALESSSVVFEMKAGPYDPDNDKQFAPWAPKEGEPEAAPYLATLEDDLRRRFGLGERTWGKG